MKKFAIMLMLAVIVSATVAAFSFETIHQDPIAQQRFTSVVHYDDVAEGSTVRVMIPELGIYRSSHTDSEGRRARFIMDVPDDTYPGEYLVRYTVSDDEGTHVRHRWITIE